MFCRNCGTQRNAELKFCTSCGAAFEERPRSPQPPQPQAHYPQPQQPQAHYPQQPLSQPQVHYPQQPQQQPQAHYPQHSQDYPQQDAYPQGTPYQGYSQANYPMQPPVAPLPQIKAKRKSKAKFIAMGCVLALLLAGGITAWAVIFNNPSLAVSRAMGNMTDEVTQRLETSPLQAFGMLFDALNSGTVNVNFEYHDEWWSENWGGGSHTSSGNFSLTSDANAGAYALTGSVQVDDYPNLSFAAYINRDRVAFGSLNFSSNYYGFRFNTFRQDFIPFGQDTLGLGHSEMGMVSDVVEEIGALLRRSDESAAEQLEPYVDAFTQFLLNAEVGSERGVDVRVGLQTISARRVDYEITIPALAALLNSWADILERDESVRAAFNNPLYSEMFGADAHSEMIQGLRSMVREMQNEVQGRLTLSFYIGSGNRLVQISLTGTVSERGRSVRIGLVLNFGASLTDTWSLSTTVITEWATLTNMFVWEINDTGGRTVNRLAWYTENDDIYSLLISWNPHNGDFVVTFEETYEQWGHHVEELFEGNFTTTGQHFSMRFEHRDFWDWSGGWDEISFFIEISTDSRTDTGGGIDFINISQWNDAWLDRLDDMFWDLGW